MLKIENLQASIDDKSILKGLNLEVKAGEVHAIMGPNGAGKSTLANIIAGKEEYEVTNGTIELNGEDISELAPEERAPCTGRQRREETGGASTCGYRRRPEQRRTAATCNKEWRPRPTREGGETSSGGGKSRNPHCTRPPLTRPRRKP